MKINWREEIRSLLSLVIFIAVVAYIFQSWEISLIWATSLGIHEIGHILAVSLVGIDWSMRFGVFGAYTTTPAAERKALSHFKNSLIHLAGPLFSLLYALIALLVYVLTNQDSDRLLRLANFSALVGLLNLLPMGRVTDGGKVLEKVIASLDRPGEKVITWLPVIWGVATILAIAFASALRRVHPAAVMLQSISIFLIVVWLLLGLLYERYLDDPNQVDATRAMTTHQARRMILAVWILLLSCSMIILVTPFWLTQEVALGLAQRFADSVPFLLMIVRFSLMVIILMVAHELAHYLVARICRIQVNRVVIGRPHGKLLWRFHLGGHPVEIYNNLPIFMALDVDDDALAGVNGLKRITFALSGSAMNIALVLLAAGLAAGWPAGARLGAEMVANSFRLIGLFFLAPFGFGGSGEFFGLYPHLQGIAAAAGVTDLILLWMLLNGIVAAANLLPFPGLDGGLILLSGVMGLTGRQRSRAAFERWYGLAPRVVAWLPWVFVGLCVYHLVAHFISA